MEFNLFPYFCLPETRAVQLVEEALHLLVFPSTIVLHVFDAHIHSLNTSIQVPAPSDR